MNRKLMLLSCVWIGASGMSTHLLAKMRTSVIIEVLTFRREEWQLSIRYRGCPQPRITVYTVLEFSNDMMNWIHFVLLRAFDIPWKVEACRQGEAS